MAYDKKFFTLGRGSYNNYATLDNAAQHIYKSQDDLLATIIAPSFFPANFNFDINNVKVGDIIDIYGTDDNNTFIITDVTNVAFSAQQDLRDETFVFGTLLTGIYASDQPITIELRKVGKLITVHVPTVSATANTAALMTTTAQVGAVLVPEFTTQQMVPITDNGSAVLGALSISGLDDPGNEGLFTWGVGPGLGTFTGTAASGTVRNYISYFTS